MVTQITYRVIRKKTLKWFWGITPGILELVVILTHVTQKPMPRVVVDARA